MRIELQAMFENRRKYWEVIGDQKYPSNIQIILRLRGDRLREVVRLGRPIVEQFVDDTGMRLFDPGEYEPRQLTATRAYQIKEVDLKYGIELRVGGRMPNRQARKISRLRGYVNLMYASQPVALTFPEPRRYVGKTLEHRLIDKLGIPLKVRMIPARDAGLKIDASSFALAYDQGRDHVRDVYVLDEWLRAIKVQASSATTPGGQEVTVYRMMRGVLNRDCELVLVVYPHVEKDRIPIEFYDIELP